MGDILDQKDQRGVKAALLRDLDLEQVLDRDVEHLSGGELQRFAIAVVAAQLADVYMIDEPSSYLDVRQRLKAAQVIMPVLHIEGSCRRLRRSDCHLSSCDCLSKHGLADAYSTELSCKPGSCSITVKNPPEH